jgi:hypothetical protein
MIHKIRVLRRELFTISNIENESRTFIRQQYLKPRLESHFKSNLFPEMSVLLLENEIGKLIEIEKNENSKVSADDAKLSDSVDVSGGVSSSASTEYLEFVRKEITEFRIKNDLDRLHENKNTDHIMKTFSTPLSSLPTIPNSYPSPFTSWLIPYTDQSKPKQKRALPNPIDYTSIPSALLHASPDPPPPTPFTPLPHRMPCLEGIDLEITTDEAIGNK